eukprot:TRINITY_DN22618_c0_g1_i1.p1 TRINITY_DN22618_c0_g1~~TRINITY_DN22618_c0_g1_i1.p1  ORF type:complete len:555 (-),score=73.48 TRINITY_DN22618_c0_g1_i1:88-1752(-)
MSRRLIALGGKAIVGGVGFATVGSSAGLAYLYCTDESWKRAIEFTAKVTPMSWAYSKAYFRTAAESAERKSAMQELHKRWAPDALRYCLELGGYYVKLGQMFCGMGLLPAAYEEEFQCLLDSVPPKPFHVVKHTLELEFGKPLEQIFESLEENAVAAASIGQVHLAKLKDGQDVVVKIQYPEVEKFFHMDFQVMKACCTVVDTGISKQNMDSIFGEMTKSFEEEFDYRREAENMKTAARNMAPHFGTRVRVPLPVDSLCTRKVLTMERIRGEPIKKHMARTFDEMAVARGKSRQELEAELRKHFEDPEELRKLLSRPAPAEWHIKCYQKLLRSRDLLQNARRCIYNLGVWTLGRPTVPYVWSTLPLNGPAITRLLFDVHAHQVFVDGAFNGDPHAGNVLICDDGKIGLIDYGNFQRVPDITRRLTFAKLYVAMAKDHTDRPDTWNDAEIANALCEAGAKVKHGNVRYLAFTALSSYDMRLDLATLERFGFKADFSDLDKLIELDEIEEFPADMINLQRLCQTLVGLAGLIGAGQPSCSRMWQPACKDFLQTASL